MILRKSSISLPQRGFTLVELLVVLAIVAILAAVAGPNLTDFMTEQRVRSAATEVLAELAGARAEAIKQHRRVVFERTGTSWKGGWQIYVDVDASNAFNTGDILLKTFPGYGQGSMGICASGTDFADRIVFRGDGTVGNAPIGAEAFLRVEDRGSRGAASLRARNLVLSPAGRASLEVLSIGVAALCS